jgi:copper chaperone NosL
MTVLDQRLAAQIVAPGDDPLFFDDIGCLAEYVKNHSTSADARAYVADHSSGAWIAATDAIYSRSESMPTPMGSHIMAHAGEAARRADTDASTARRMSSEEVFGPAGVPGGRRAR